jgi:hypothetical protein
MRSDGSAPFDNQYRARSKLSSTGWYDSDLGGAGSYTPSTSTCLPSLGALLGATTILYNGLFFCPMRANLILKDILKMATVVLLN